MTKNFETINLGELIDLLVFYTEKYSRLSSQYIIGREFEECKVMLGYLLVEIEKRKEYLHSYN